MSQATHFSEFIGTAEGAKILPLVRNGLPVGTVDRFIDSGAISAAELHELVLPRKTFANRRKLGRLTPEQSDRLVRVARVLAGAEDTFGARDIAHRWLRRPSDALEGAAPLTLLDTDEGARMVEALLLRIAHGIAA
ncbi:antitoxin Xre/MbcA/ParS toxin-binding domain-containing protein [Acidocella sp.]|uniref:type II RES/Xre toxin-antitoxin system antitoxin n=1 Tax=Acidocella sp. TaxID=50710 RepID=UPI00261AC0AB|nr:antitoxin Xre/MbcA/ParS toxin-binding domain-containing protein [Acidocella sp.]